jgi:hypothetical protein
MREVMLPHEDVELQSLDLPESVRILKKHLAEIRFDSSVEDIEAFIEKLTKGGEKNDENFESYFCQHYADPSHAGIISDGLEAEEKQKIIYMCFACEQDRKIRETIPQGFHPAPASVAMLYLQPLFNIVMGIQELAEQPWDITLKPYAHQNDICTRLHEQCETCEWKLQRSLDKKYPKIATQPEKIYPEGDVEAKQLKAVRELKGTLEDTTRSPSARIDSFQSKSNHPDTKQTLQQIEGGAFWRTIRAILERLIPLEFFRSAGKQFMQEVEKTTAALQASPDIVV